MTKLACPFCTSDNSTLKDNAYAQVILSNPRKVPGHFLVVPKRHVEHPWDLTKDEIQNIFELIFYLEQRIIGRLGDGVDIRQNYRPFVQESRLKVNHLHFHVIPRSFQDYIYKVSEKYEDDLFADLDDVERAEVAKLLKD